MIALAQTLTDDDEQETNDYQGNNHLHLRKKQHTLNEFQRANSNANV